MAGGMSWPRQIIVGATYMVTRRTTGRFHLFVPGRSRIRECLLYVLAVVAERHGILIHALVLMSDHVHYVATDRFGRISMFLQEFHRVFALCVKELHGWEGSVWDSGKPSIVQLLTPNAIVEKVGYTLANPVAAGLVRRGQDWPGVRLSAHEHGEAPIAVRRPDVYFDPHNRKWPEVAELRLTLPPKQNTGLEPDEVRAQIQQELELQEQEARAEMAREGRHFVGAERCTRVSPFERAKSREPKRNRNPTFALGRGATREAYIEAVVALRAFRAAYRQALDRWRAAEREVEFPCGTWWMQHFHGVRVAAPLAAAA
jgi:putative transposase